MPASRQLDYQPRQPANYDFSRSGNEWRPRGSSSNRPANNPIGTAYVTPWNDERRSGRRQRSSSSESDIGRRRGRDRDSLRPDEHYSRSRFRYSPDDRVPRTRSGNRTPPYAEANASIRPDKFNGVGSVESFLSKFSIAVCHNGWSPETAAAQLKSCLVGDAGVLVQLHENATYEEMVERLLCRYGTSDAQEKYRWELRHHVQQPGESLRALAGSIEQLVLGAYPEAMPKLRNELMVDAFIGALHNGDLKFRLIDKHLQTLHDVIREARWQESVRASCYMTPDDVRPKRARAMQAEPMPEPPTGEPSGQGARPRRQSGPESAPRAARTDNQVETRPREPASDGSKTTETSPSPFC